MFFFTKKALVLAYHVQYSAFCFCFTIKNILTYLWKILHTGSLLKKVSHPTPVVESDAVMGSKNTVIKPVAILV